MHFSEDINTFNYVAWIADDHETFIKMIDEAIEKNSEKKVKERIKRAEQNTWTARVEQFWDIVDNWEKAEKDNV